MIKLFQIRYKAIMKRTGLKVVVALTLLLLPGLASAQDLPCGGDDPYGVCPLDSWVYLLIPVVLIFAGFQLYKQQKRTTF